MGTILLLTTLTMIAFELGSVISFFIYLSCAENIYTSAEQICLTEVGCLDNNFPWVTFPVEKWPVVRMRSIPLKPSEINPELVLWSDGGWIPIRNKSDFDQLYNRQKKTVVAIHGWSPTAKKYQHMEVFSDLFSILGNNEFNKLAIDWKKGSSGLNYPLAYNNMRVVGHIMAHKFIDYDVEMEHLHLIGHSLGAHMSGYIGKLVQTFQNGRKIGRITGLDPAGPGFDFPSFWYKKYDNLTLTHLWHTDAQFVDVIHTDSGKFGNGHYGLEKSLGHADFYPSNGRDQPFCRANTFYKQVRKMERMIYTNFYRTIKGMQTTCNHRIAPIYLIHSVNHYESYYSCSNDSLPDCNFMGFHSTKPSAGRRKYYLSNGDLPHSFP